MPDKEMLIIIADQFHNNDCSDDDELQEFLVAETGIDVKKIAELIREERPKFLRGDYLKFSVEEDVKILAKYFKEE